MPRENGYVRRENCVVPCENGIVPRKNGLYISNNINVRNKAHDYCSYLDDAIFGSPDVVKNVTLDNLKVKRHNKGLVAMGMACDDERSTTDEIIKHNIEKVQFYEQDVCPSFEDVFVSIICFFFLMS